MASYHTAKFMEIASYNRQNQNNEKAVSWGRWLIPYNRCCMRSIKSLLLIVRIILRSPVLLLTFLFGLFLIYAGVMDILANGF